MPWGNSSGVSPVTASVTTAVAVGASNLVIVMGLLLAIPGLRQSSGWGPLTKNIGEFFLQREWGRVMGFWCTNYALGGFIAAALAGWAVEQFGSWRYAFGVPAAVLGVVWQCCCFSLTIYRKIAWRSAWAFLASASCCISLIRLFPVLRRSTSGQKKSPQPPLD